MNRPYAQINQDITSGRISLKQAQNDVAQESPRAESLLKAAKQALRGYQYGTGSRDLAAGIADAIGDYLNNQRKAQ